MLLVAAAFVLYAIAASQGWIRDPSLAKADYAGTIDVLADDAKLYRAVPFEWLIRNIRQNLLHDRHSEFGPEATRVAIARSAYAKLAWWF